MKKQKKNGNGSLRKKMPCNLFSKAFFHLFFLFILIFAQPATAIDISNDPMDSIAKPAPSNIMFLLDNSGSMDWEYMTKDADNGGLFRVSAGSNQIKYYLYNNPGDNSYTSGSYSYYPNADQKQFWKGKCFGINKMFYNPYMKYDPWKGKDINGDEFENASTTEPFSNPYEKDSNDKFNLTSEYYALAAGNIAVIVDDQDTCCFEKSTGGWSDSEDNNKFGSYYLYTGGSTGNVWAKWTPVIEKAGKYKIYIHYNANSGSRITEVKYKVKDNSGTSEYTQTFASPYGDFQTAELAEVEFDAGQSGYVMLELTDPGSSQYVADAVKFVYQDEVIDAVSVKNAHYFTFDDTDKDGELDDSEQVYLVNFNSTTNVRDYYEINDTDGFLESGEAIDIIELPEDLRPAIFKEDGTKVRDKTDAEDLQNFADWYSYYRRREYTAKAAVGKVIDLVENVNVGLYSLHSTGGARLPVLPIGITKLGAEVIVDNRDSNYDEYGGGWHNSSGNPPYDTESRYTDNTNAYAKWTPDLPTSGDYEVFIWYTDAGTRDKKAKYTVNYDGGSEDFEINQQENDGEWVRLDSFHFNAGTSGNVTLTRLGSGGDYGTSTCADAVKFVNNATTTVLDKTEELLNELYAMNSNNGTPLRDTLKNVGEYYAGNLTSLGNSPYDEWQSDGAECMQSFTIAMTDGFWYGSDTGVGNADEHKGAPYAGSQAETLADVAMYYYDTDLSSLDNSVPVNNCDMSQEQHMVTYTVSFGITGTLVPYDADGDGITDYDPQSPGDYLDPCFLNPATVRPTWPNIDKNDDCPEKIDDLYHAAVNGRGLFFSATDPEQLVNSLEKIMGDVGSRDASGSSVSVNGDELKEDTALYQASYLSEIWTGNVQAFSVSMSGSVGTTPIWDAQVELQDTDWNTERNILTYNGTDVVPFRYTDDLTSAQKTALDSNSAMAEKVLNYLRGNTADVVTENFRSREKILGDIVHSAPVLHGKSIYAGGNDGMLHVFDAGTGSDAGKERFAYIPNLVFNNLKNLADKNYIHAFYVDGTPYVKAGVKLTNPDRIGTLLVGGLNRGGKGYYALDITSADTYTGSTDESAIAAAIEMWEYPPNGTTDDDLGYTYSQPFIAKVYADNADGYEWAVIFGNGYVSNNAHAVLYIVRASDGTVIKKIDTGPESEKNGLSTPVILETDKDDIIDYVFAGDLLGNMWKFDLTYPGTGTAENYWGVAYGKDNSKEDSDNKDTGAINYISTAGTPDEPKPVFTAKYDGSGQAITTKPHVKAFSQCSATSPGFLVVFGTGKYLGDSDRDTPFKINTMYGIWDYGDKEDNEEYIGEFDAKTDTLTRPSGAHEYEMLKQEEIFAAVTEGSGMLKDLGVLSNNQPVYATEADTDSGENPNPTDGSNVGWYFNLPLDGERIIKDAIIWDQNAILISFVPETNACSGGGYSILNEMPACTGAQLVKPQFDINLDSKVNDDDKITITVNSGPSPVEYTLPPNRKKFAGMLHLPKIVEAEGRDIKFFGTSSSAIVRVAETQAKQGAMYWREITQ